MSDYLPYPQVEYTQDGGEMSRRLRSVSHELDRVADLLEERTSDAIGFYNEVNMLVFELVWCVQSLRPEINPD